LPAFRSAEDLKSLEESPTIRMKLGRSEVKLVQNFNLEVGEGKPNLKLVQQRLSIII
jgi:hypothetical protein